MPKSIGAMLLISMTGLVLSSPPEAILDGVGGCSDDQDSG